MLSERSRTQKDDSCVAPFIRDIQNRQIHRDRKWISYVGAVGDEG